MPTPPTIVDELDAIAAEPSHTPMQRYRNAASVKAVAWRAAFAGDRLPHAWTFDADGVACDVTLTAVTINDGAVVLWGEFRRDGVTVTRYADGALLWPIVVQNPPVLCEVPTGDVVRNDRAFVLDIVATAQNIVTRVVSEAST